MVSFSKQRGFTLIEMLVSLALFTIVAVMAVGTLLVLIGSNGRVTAEQNVMTALTYALDSMTREIRTGSEYYCGTVAQVTGSSVYNSVTAVRDCLGGDKAISFREAGESITGGTSASRIAYYFDNNSLYRKVGSGTAQEIATGDIQITEADSYFFVAGSNPSDVATNNQQPNITVVINAKDNSNNSTKDFIIQTTVTQRPLDI